MCNMYVPFDAKEYLDCYKKEHRNNLIDFTNKTIQAVLKYFFAV